MRATDKDGLMGDGTLTINIVDVNEPAVFAEGLSISRQLDENPSLINTLVGIPIIASDVDGGDEGTKAYAIMDGNVNNAFNIVPETGQLRVQTPAEINHESSTIRRRQCQS